VSEENSMDKCVLVVDDNDFNRELVRDILEDEDITVYEAEDGSSAIELLESEQADDIDAVLMDVRMPGIDGIETTKIIRTKNGKCTDVPIIAMTADGFGTEMEMLQKIGMNGLISKPVDVNTLVEQITELAGW
jgi:CheY-like chemotaxis protein